MSHYFDYYSPAYSRTISPLVITTGAPVDSRAGLWITCLREFRYNGSVWGMSMDSLVTILGVVAVILTVLTFTRSEINRLDSKIDKVEARLAGRMDSLELRVDRLDIKLERQINRLDNRINMLEGRIYDLAIGRPQAPLDQENSPSTTYALG